MVNFLLNTANSDIIGFKKYLIILFLLFPSYIILMGSCKKTKTPPIIVVTPPDPPLRGPNVILILADDVGYEIPEINGGQSYSTPNINFLGKNGVRFTKCFSTPLCSPSRFMLLTGKYNFRNYTSWGNMGLGEKTLGNMFRDNGYKTACYGKWQLGGGDVSIHTFGFDNYSVWNPLEADTKESRYKNPQIYEHGNFLPSSLTLNKYGDDIFTDSLLNFIDSNKTRPFFAYYAMCLTHSPFSPTPDDPEFEYWDPTLGISERKFFPSMVKYMDKKIGMIINKLQELGLENNTLILFVGDNGTAQSINSRFENRVIRGGKGLTTDYGTHVPLMAFMRTSVAPGVVNDDLICFADFLPTFAEIAKITYPTNYGILDGVSFAPRLLGMPSKPREWIFCHFDPLQNGVSNPIRWVQNKTYKLYNIPYSSFYNIIKDSSEINPIQFDSLTAQEMVLRQQFQQVITLLHN